MLFKDKGSVKEAEKSEAQFVKDLFSKHNDAYLMQVDEEANQGSDEQHS